MKASKFNTPILMVIFNKPETTQTVFDVIKQIQPANLYVSADGARSNKNGEKQKCEQVRSIFNNIDWECELKTNFSKTNLGCKLGVSSAINWFFENVEEGIILEDDTLPDLSFFSYCQELLTKYRDNSQIMMISGDNFQFNRSKIEESYYFSKLSHIWGWATWKRAWKLYDINMNKWKQLEKYSFLNSILNNKRASVQWAFLLNKVYAGKVNTWDYQWLFACWANDGLCILPKINLVENIGFGKEALHTNNKSVFANTKKYGIKLPLIHPEKVERNTIADQITISDMVKEMSLFSKIYRKLNRIFND